MRLASTSTAASSGTRPPSTTLSAASQAASKPEDSLARPIDLSVRLLPAESIRSIPSTSPGGMSCLIVDSPKALGLAIMAGTSERGFRTAGPSPKALGGDGDPAAAVGEDLHRRRAHADELTPTVPGGPGDVLAPVGLDVAAPVCAAARHAASNSTPGRARMAARSSRQASPCGLPPRRRAAALTLARPSARNASDSGGAPDADTGTRRLRRRSPTAFSTEPFPFPE